MILGLHILRVLTMAKCELSTAFSHVLMTLLKPWYKIDPSPKTSKMISDPYVNKSASAIEAAYFMKCFGVDSSTMCLNWKHWLRWFHNSLSMFHPIFSKFRHQISSCPSVSKQLTTSAIGCSKAIAKSQRRQVSQRLKAAL